MNNRQDINKHLLALLAELIEMYPQMRWQQILQNFDFIVMNEWGYYVESDDALKNVEIVLGELKK